MPMRSEGAVLVVCFMLARYESVAIHGDTMHGITRQIGDLVDS